MKLVKNLSIVTLLLLFISCSNDDDNNPPADELSVSLEFDTYRTGFYQAGETDEVTIAPDPEADAVITLEGVDPAIVTYNPLTSRIEWTNLLPLGENAVTIAATVDGTEATTNITLQNDFEGSFSGGYNFDPTDTDNLTSMNFDAEFIYIDNVVNIDDDGNSGSGTWSIEGNTLTLVFTYDNVTYFTYQGDIFNDGVEAYVDGMWYNGQEAEGVAEGYFRIDILEI